MSPQIDRDDIMSVVSSLISSSSFNDAEIADKVGVSRQMIFKWRTKKVSSIRKSNLVSLAEALDHKIEFKDNEIELDKIALKLDEGEMEMSIMAQDLIKQKDRYISLLEKTVEEKDIRLEACNEALHSLDKTIKSQADTISNLSGSPIDMNLDYSRMQFIANTVKKNFHSCTQKYADIHGLLQSDIVNDKDWGLIVSPKDYWRLPIIEAYGLDKDKHAAKRDNTWLVEPVNGHKARYFKTNAVILDDKGIFKRIDVENSTKKAWEESNEHYKSFEKGDI